MSTHIGSPTHIASRYGHLVELDPPHELSRAQRWTCTRCGHAVLRYNGNIYGSAVEHYCAWLQDPTQPWLRDADLLERWFLILARTLAFDFDGVIHPYTDGWVGSTPADEPPMPGVTDVLATLKHQGYRIVVFSTRCDHPEGLEGTKAWLAAWNLMRFVDDVSCQKPAAIAYVDDRAVPYVGSWDDVMVGIERLASQGRPHGAAAQFERDNYPHAEPGAPGTDEYWPVEE